MRVAIAILLVVCSALPLRGQAQAPAESPERLDYLTFAQGAIPVTISPAGEKLGANWTAAVRVADGDPAKFAVLNQAPPDASVEFVFELPGPTTFDRLAVPDVLETPSPGQTFFKTVEVYGSSSSATDGFSLLASGTLTAHARRGEVTELKLASKSAVRWVRLRLAGSLLPMRPLMSLEFTEIIGNGTQGALPLATHFQGAWQMRAESMVLQQAGPVVSGCYDKSGELKGTVTGNILRATGVDLSDKTPSAFILALTADGSLRGVRSSNKAPFRLYTSPKSTTALSCPRPPAPSLGCGSTIHGITFDVASATLRPESAPVLEALFKGLGADASASVTIEGHTSSEGTEPYNQKLSEARAQSVVADLTRRGIAAGRLRAAGFGETRPIATNVDESGRAMNRRVEIRCQ